MRCELKFFYFRILNESWVVFFVVFLFCFRNSGVNDCVRHSIRNKLRYVVKSSVWGGTLTEHYKKNQTILDHTKHF